MSDLAPGYREFTATISKTVQEQQYEPISVTLTTRGVCTVAEYEAEQDAAYQQLKRKIQTIFGGATPEPQQDTWDGQNKTGWNDPNSKPWL